MSSSLKASAVKSPSTFAVSYINREKHHIEREKSGELTAHYIWNDGSDQNSIFLIGLKNVFSRCLPNMPKEYICRLLFERRHRSVVIVRNGKAVIGGITYRPFHSQQFAEIAFCAIAQSLQVSGYGTRLMNWTKQYARCMDQCEYFLTYADNNAVGYFSKQGFTKTPTMDKARWQGYIKDYDGGTLMECFIHPTLPFTTLPDVLKVQREALESEIRKYTTGNIIVYDGLSRWKEHEIATTHVPEAAQVPEKLTELVEQQKNKAAQQDKEYVPPTMPPNEIDWSNRPSALKPEEIPGLKESGWIPPKKRKTVRVILDGSLVDATDETVVACMHSLIERLKDHEDSWPFQKPVNAWEVPDYYSVVTDPMDIEAIEKRLKNAYYVSMDQFAADVDHMFENAKKYNSSDTIFYKLAKRLQTLFHGWVRECIIHDV